MVPKINKKLKKYLPQTTAGLVRYYEEESAKVEIDPKHLIAISFAIILLITLKYILS